MATYSNNPARYTGVERSIADALVKLTTTGAYPLELKVPFPTPQAAHAAKARLWAYCRALEGMGDIKRLTALGYDVAEQAPMLARARTLRNFTSRVLPVHPTDTTQGVHLHLLAQASRPEDSAAMDYLTDILMSGDH